LQESEARRAAKPVPTQALAKSLAATAIWHYLIAVGAALGRVAALGLSAWADALRETPMLPA
jgi:cell division septal protein FtsQ